MSRERFQVVAIAIIAAALVLAAAVYARLHRPFISPLTITTASPVYLPLVLKSHRFVPDRRFGIAEHSLEQMLLLGFPNDGRYKWVQHAQPEKTDTVRGLRPAQRDHHSTGYSVRMMSRPGDGRTKMDFAGLCASTMG